MRILIYLVEYGFLDPDLHEIDIGKKIRTLINANVRQIRIDLILKSIRFVDVSLPLHTLFQLKRFHSEFVLGLYCVFCSLKCATGPDSNHS